MKLKRWITCLLVVISLLSLCACNGAGGKPTNGTVTLQFWGWGDDVEASVFQEITNRFNETVGKEKNITVKYVQKASSSYSSDTALALSGNHTPDIVYVEDSGEFSGFDFANAGGEIWDNAISRYRFDPETATSSETAPLWALPKDIGPTVLYYNASYL